MASPQEILHTEIKDALRSGDKDRLRTNRLLLSEVKNKSLELGREVGQTELLSLVQKAIKQRREAAQMYRDGSRPELVDKELAEIAILEGYLPPAADEDEIRKGIQALVDEKNLEGPGAIGVIMKEMMARLAGSADGATINRLAREILSPKSG